MRLGDASLRPVLDAAAGSSDALSRALAARGLGALMDPSAFERLAPLLKDKDAQVVVQAVRALGAIGDARACPCWRRCCGAPAPRCARRRSWPSPRCRRTRPCVRRWWRWSRARTRACVGAGAARAGEARPRGVRAGALGPRPRSRLVGARGHGHGAGRGRRRDQPGRAAGHGQGRGRARPAGGAGGAAQGARGGRGGHAAPAARPRGLSVRAAAAEGLGELAPPGVVAPLLEMWKRAQADTELDARIAVGRAGRASAIRRRTARSSRSRARTAPGWCAARGGRAQVARPASRVARLRARAAAGPRLPGGDGALRPRRARALHAARDPAHASRPHRDPSRHRGGAAHHVVLHRAGAQGLLQRPPLPPGDPRLRGAGRRPARRRQRRPRLHAALRDRAASLSARRGRHGALRARTPAAASSSSRCLPSRTSTASTPCSAGWRRGWTWWSSSVPATASSASRSGAAADARALPADRAGHRRDAAAQRQDHLAPHHARPGRGAAAGRAARAGDGPPLPGRAQDRRASWAARWTWCCTTAR